MNSTRPPVAHMERLVFDPALLKDQPVTMRMFQERFRVVKVHSILCSSKDNAIDVAGSPHCKKDPQRALDDAENIKHPEKYR